MSTTHERPSDNPQSVEASWHIPDVPKTATGWLVFSLDYVLAALQGCAAQPKRTCRSAGWVIIGESVRVVMAVLQFLIMMIAHIPVLGSIFESIARGYSRDSIGFFIRACYWKARLKRLGCDTIIDQGVDIWGPANVTIGSRCHLGTHARLAAGERKHGQYGNIIIGDFVHLGPNVHIAGRGGVTIGDLVGISAAVHIYSATNLVLDREQPDRLISMSHMAPSDLQAIHEKPIAIGDYAFVGIMARILPGVTIGKGAVIHANTELTSDVPAFANFGGQAKGGKSAGANRCPAK